MRSPTLAVALLLLPLFACSPQALDSQAQDGTTTENTTGDTQNGGSQPDPTTGASSAGGYRSGGSGGSSSTGSTGGGGSQSKGSTGGSANSPHSESYFLPPPSQCHNQDYIDYQEGCEEGVSTSTCGGKCNTINACLESEAEKPFADVTFICPRFMQFSPEMEQAAQDDGLAQFNYAIVGHDADTGGIDGEDQSTCCQCYQLVFAYPSPDNDSQVLADPNDKDNPVSAIPLPPPLVVQSFNTAATPHSFDIYMGAGGLGANNACAPQLQPAARSGQYLYTSYPQVGQPSGGGVKPVTHFSECKTEIQWVTYDSLSSPACSASVNEACNQIESDISGLTEQARDSCLKSTDPDAYYHLNWSVYAKKVECPSHLTRVTGCKLAPQGLPPVDTKVTTADQAAADPTFFSQSTKGTMYETTTMEDCCRPSCASKDWIEGRGLVSDEEYNAFYSCDARGVPITE